MIKQKYLEVIPTFQENIFYSAFFIDKYITFSIIQYCYRTFFWNIRSEWFYIKQQQFQLYCIQQ
ncbi:hypothetical protein pb186bvf_012095 [Paramecium bursaria]